MKYLPADEILEIALEHQARGADISKIVTNADTTEQQLENLKAINLLKKELKIPFLYLCGGKCEIVRRIGGQFGCCMYLCVHEHDDLATATQPLVKDVKTIFYAGKYKSKELQQKAVALLIILHISNYIKFKGNIMLIKAIFFDEVGTAAVRADARYTIVDPDVGFAVGFQFIGVHCAGQLMGGIL